MSHEEKYKIIEHHDYKNNVVLNFCSKISATPKNSETEIKDSLKNNRWFMQP